MPPRLRHTFLELEVFCGRRGRGHYDIVKEVAAVDENGQIELHMIVRPPREVPADVELNRDRWTQYHHLSWDLAPLDSVNYDEVEEILKNFGNSHAMVHSTFGVATPYIRSLGFPVKIEDPLPLRPKQGCAYHPQTVYCALARAQLAVTLYRQLWFPTLSDPLPGTLGEQLPRANAPRENESGTNHEESVRNSVSVMGAQESAQTTVEETSLPEAVLDSQLQETYPTNTAYEISRENEAVSEDRARITTATSNYDFDLGNFSPGVLENSPVDLSALDMSLGFS